MIKMILETLPAVDRADTIAGLSFLIWMISLTVFFCIA